MIILGPSFDIKDFHDVVLRKGPVSLGILDDMVEEWIDDIVHSSASNGIWTITSCYCNFYINILILLKVMS